MASQFAEEEIQVVLTKWVMLRLILNKKASNEKQMCYKGATGLGENIYKTKIRWTTCSHNLQKTLKTQQ